MEECIKNSILLVSVGHMYLELSSKHVKMSRMCTIIRSSQSRAGRSSSFLHFLKFGEVQPAKAVTLVTVMYYDTFCFKRYLPSSEASTVLCIWFRIDTPPSVLFCCAGLVLLDHLVTEPNAASNDYCQYCNRDAPGSFVEPERFTKSRYDLTVIRKYANHSLHSCKYWNGHDPAALGQSGNLAPFTSFLRWEVTKPDSACPCAHLCRLLQNLHQRWLSATREVKRVISHE